MTASASKDYLSRTEFEAFERNVAQGFADVREGLNGLSAKVDMLTSRGTDWKALIGAISLVLAIITAVGGVIAFGLQQQIGTNKESAQSSEDALYEIAKSRWTREDHERYRAAIEAEMDETKAFTLDQRNQLDDQLQREMRLLDDALQREMRMLLDAPQVQINRLEDTVELLRVRVEEHQRDGHPNAVIERIAALEKLLQAQGILRYTAPRGDANADR